MTALWALVACPLAGGTGIGPDWGACCVRTDPCAVISGASSLMATPQEVLVSANQSLDLTHALEVLPLVVWNELPALCNRLSPGSGDTIPGLPSTADLDLTESGDGPAGGCGRKEIFDAVNATSSGPLAGGLSLPDISSLTLQQRRRGSW